MNNHGFTLIEVIVVIVMISLASVAIVSFFDNSIVRSADPIAGLEDNFSVVKAIEIVNADYRARLTADASQSMSIYNKSNLGAAIPGLGGIQVKGEYISFSAPDANRKVRQTSAGSPSMFVKITAVKNNSKLVTIIGN